jgi:hypothetical protein
MIKTVLIFVLTCGLVGGLIASLIVPPALTWYITPGGLPEGAQVQAIVQIPQVIRYATGKLMRAQAIGVGIGAVVGLIAGIFFLRRSPSSPASVPAESGSDIESHRAKNRVGPHAWLLTARSDDN